MTHAASRWNHALAVAACAALAVSLAGLVLVGDLRATPRPAIALLMAAGLAYVLVALALARGWSRWEGRERRRWLTAVLVLSIGLRMILMLVPPSLSDDIYRYRWDGRIQAQGLNPYAEPPASATLEPYRDALWEQINYPRIRSIYPPLAQVLFAVAYRLGDSLRSFQVVAMAGDLLVIGLVLLLATRWGLPGWIVALYALHPLPIVEYASSGHFDAWVAAAVLAAVAAHVAARPLLSTTLLAAAILLKTWPVILVPLLLRRRPWWHLPLLVALVVAAYLPFRDAGAAMLQPWLDYTGRWRFNDGAYFLLRHIGGSLEAGKALAAALGAGLFLRLWRRDTDPVSGGYWLTIAFIALMPTIHPWYMLWALPLAALAVDLGWVALCTLAPLAYWILVGAAADSNVWIEPWWPRFAEYLPAAALWAWQARRFGPAAPGRTGGVVTWITGTRS